MQNKKVPLRMCSGCMEHFPKKELVRVVRSSDGTISIDATGKKSGRGAYIRKNKECLRKAAKAKRFEKAFECQIPTQIYERLEEELSDAE